MRSQRRAAVSWGRRRLCFVLGLLPIATRAWSGAPAAPVVPTSPAAPIVRVAPNVRIASTFRAASVVRAEQPPRATPRPLFALSLGGAVLGTEDLRRTYGTVPAVGLWVHVNDGPSGQYFLGIQCCSKRGNPLYGDPVFEGGETARLTVMSVRIGLRGNLRPRHRLGLFLGFAGEHSRIWKTVRGVFDPGLQPARKDRSWGWGGRLLAGPEFEFSPGRWAVGTELSLGFHLTHHESRYDRWTGELSGAAVRAYVGRRF